jgi:proteic killer suppression protein
VIVSFADDTTRDVYDGADTRAARRIPKALWPVARHKLDALAAAAALKDLRIPPGNRLERLHGDRYGRWSIRVNDQFRLTFRFEDGHASGVCCEDYH